MIIGTTSTEDYLSSVRLTAHFTGPSPVADSVGTGFLVRREDDIFLVTNRHVIGENHKSPAERSGKLLSGIDIDIWHRLGAASTYRHKSFTNLQLQFSECSKDNDLAATKLQISGSDTFDFLSLLVTYDVGQLATSQHLEAAYSPGMLVFICGYPKISPVAPPTGNSPMPLMRRGIFSSIPGLALRIPNKLGDNYGYIDSFAIGGMSGSPVIVPQVGFPGPQSVIKNHLFHEKCVSGIIVGRVNSDSDTASGTHSGLSYFVNSQAIVDLLATL